MAKGSEMSSKAIMDRVRVFLGRFISNPEIDPADNLFTSGVVSSLLAMQLVLYVEKEFDIEVADEDLDMENFKSLNAIVGFIERKSGTKD
jgi:methoxymalonate biosynthesis acyl carrier protein